MLDRNIFGGLMVSAAFALSAGTALAADYTWQVQSVVPETDADWYVTLTRMKEVVEEASGGAVEMQIFPVGALVGEDSVVEAVSSGAVDGAHIIAGFAANVAPSVLGTEMPFGVKNPEEHHALHYEAGLLDIMAAEYAASNIEVLGIGTSGQLVFMSSDPIETTEDLSGQKIWTIPNASWLAAFGAAPAEVPGFDMYSAMRLGTIDGFTWTLGELEAGNFKEAVKHVLQPALLVPGTHLIINQDRWNELPEEMRADIKAGLEAAHLDIAAEYAAVDAKAVEAAKEYGVQFTEVDPASLKAMQEAADSFWSEVESASPAAAEMVSAYRDFLAR
ncbi:TRAP transporter substrate-binding protein [Tropicibacter alexandrii]|uniref:TRAP transporter substrate-binding protein n=1 Tax=Tropicibacter alexandrii TaxID=2267683 RepID=UPI0013E8E89E|nr:TRAP transporter substrate-binding protein DctP [Tropicibacter alexandrii]